MYFIFLNCSKNSLYEDNIILHFHSSICIQIRHFVNFQLQKNLHIFVIDFVKIKLQNVLTCKSKNTKKSTVSNFNCL